MQSAPQSAPTGMGQFATDGSKYHEVQASNFGVTFGSVISAFGFYATDIESDVQIIPGHAVGGSETFGFASLFCSSLYGMSFAVPSGSVNFLDFGTIGGRLHLRRRDRLISRRWPGTINASFRVVWLSDPLDGQRCPIIPISVIAT